MPFSNSLDEYIRKNPQFRNSMKLYNPKRFIPLGTIFLSRSPDHPTDEVIGILYCDIDNVKKNRHPFFKQDFVINHGNKNFTSYTSIKTQSKNIKHINDFFAKYGNRKYYGTDKGRGGHHYNDVLNLHPLLQSEAYEILKKVKYRFFKIFVFFPARPRRVLIPIS